MRKKMVNNIQVLDLRLIKTQSNENNKNTQTQTEEFRAQPTSPLYYETEEQWPKAIRIQTLIFPNYRTRMATR